MSFRTCCIIDTFFPIEILLMQYEVLEKIMRRVIILLTVFRHRVVTFDLRAGVVGCGEGVVYLT